MYLFVGEKRSPRAIQMGVTWADGRLCAKTLGEALSACNIAPHLQSWENAFLDGPAWTVDEAAIERVRVAAAEGRCVVGLGRRVQRLLAARGIPHRPLTHPAARGAIRRTAAYRAHVAAVLDAGASFNPV